MKPFRTTLLASLLVLAASFTLSNDEKTGLALGDKAPMTEVEMKGTDDISYTLTKLAGKKGLIVIFSCNTCPFVVGSDNFKGWEGQYNGIYELAVKSDIGVVLVNSNAAKRGDDDSMDEMKKHAAAQGYKMPYVVDENAALADAFGAKTTPHVYFFNQEMKLIYHGAIDNTVDAKRETDKNYLQDAITAHSEGKTIVETSTPPRGCSIKRVK